MQRQAAHNHVHRSIGYHKGSLHPRCRVSTEPPGMRSGLEDHGSVFVSRMNTLLRPTSRCTGCVHRGQRTTARRHCYRSEVTGLAFQHYSSTLRVTPHLLCAFSAARIPCEAPQVLRARRRLWPEAGLRRRLPSRQPQPLQRARYRRQA